MNRHLIAALAISLVLHALLLAWVPTGRHRSGHSLATQGIPARPLQVTLKFSTTTPAERPAIARIDHAPSTEATPPQPPRARQRESAPLPELPRDPADFAVPPNYFAARDLTRMPSPLTSFRPQVAVGDEGQGGKMTLRLWIDVSGKPDRVSLVDSDMPQTLNDAAVDGFRNMRFTPAEINGVPVPAWLDVVIEYADLRRQADPPSASPSAAPSASPPKN